MIRLLDRFYRVFLFTCLTLLLIGVPFVFYRRMAASIVLLVVIGCVLAARRMSRRGQPEKSLVFFSSGLALVLTGLLFGGLPPGAMSIAVALSVMLSVVVGVRAGIAFAMFFLLMWLWYIVLQRLGLAPTPYFTGVPLSSWFIVASSVWMVLLPIPELVGKLRRAVSLNRAVIEAASDGILAINADDVVDTYNQRFVDLLGIPSHIVSRAASRDWLDAMAQRMASPEQFQKRLLELREHAEQTSQNTWQLADGRKLEGLSQPQLMDGRIVGRVWSFRDVTESLRAQDDLRKSKEKFEAILNATTESVFLVDPKGTALVVNATAARRLNVAVADVLGKSVFDFFPASVAASRKATLDEVFQTGLSKYLEDARGKRQFALNYYPVKGASDSVEAVAVFAQEITERRLAEQAALTLAARNQLLMQTATEGIHILDHTGHLVECNDAFANMLGYTRQELAGLSVAQWDAQWPVDQLRVKLDDLIHHGGAFETMHRRKDGSLVDVEVHTSSVVLDGETYLYAASRDISARKRAEAEIHQLAFYDALTQLPNRRLLNDRLTQMMAVCRRSGSFGAALFLDLDKFKPLNDARGHEAGDLLLAEVARRLRSCVRETDTVARFGGDEFVLVLAGLDTDLDTARQYAAKVAEKVRESLAVPYQLTLVQPDGTQVQVNHACSASIGIAMYTPQMDAATDLLKLADLAMYQAKDSGRNAIRFFESPHEP